MSRVKNYKHNHQHGAIKPHKLVQIKPYEAAIAHTFVSSQLILSKIWSFQLHPHNIHG